jgi:CheY-like chemotaxis protein
MPANGSSYALSILLVDDDRLVLVNTKAMLEAHGHSVVAVSSGMQALAALRTGAHIDLLVTDHAMPQMTGVDLATEARKLQPVLPVLLISGVAELPAGTGPNPPKLTKPFTIDELQAAMAGAINSAAARSARL